MPWIPYNKFQAAGPSAAHLASFHISAKITQPLFS